MFGKNKQILLIVILVLLSISVGVLYIFQPPRVQSPRIGILISRNNITALEFYKGLKTVLTKQGYYQGTNLNLVLKNLGNKSKVVQIMKEFIQKKVDVLVVIGDEPTIAIAHRMLAHPVIFAFINNPVADDIRKRIESERFITGVSYFPPYQRTLELSKRVIGNYHHLTLLMPEGSTWPDFDKFLAAAHDNGIKVKVARITLSKIDPSIAGLVGKTDAVYLPSVPYLIDHPNLFQPALLAAKIPVISNNLVFRDTAVLTYVAEPETMGEIAGQMIVKIYHGADPEFMPVELSTDYQLTINLRQLKKINIPINEDALSYANKVIQ